MMKVAHRDHEHVLPPSHQSDPDPDVGRLAEGSGGATVPLQIYSQHCS